MNQDQENTPMVKTSVPGFWQQTILLLRNHPKKRNKNGETPAKITYCPSSKKWIACNSHAVKQFPLLTLTKEKLK